MSQANDSSETLSPAAPLRFIRVTPQLVQHAQELQDDWCADRQEGSTRDLPEWISDVLAGGNAGERTFEAWYHQKWPMAKRLLEAGSLNTLNHMNCMRECWFEARGEVPAQPATLIPLQHQINWDTAPVDATHHRPGSIDHSPLWLKIEEGRWLFTMTGRSFWREVASDSDLVGLVERPAMPHPVAGATSGDSKAIHPVAVASDREAPAVMAEQDLFESAVAAEMCRNVAWVSSLRVDDNKLGYAKESLQHAWWGWQIRAALAAQQDNSTSGNKYRAELYDEVWQKARDLGFGNVTMALDALEKLGLKPARLEAARKAYTRLTKRTAEASGTTTYIANNDDIRALDALFGTVGQPAGS